MASSKQLTGKVETVHEVDTTIAKDLLDRFDAIHDLTGTVSDALDNFGLVGAIPASTLKPTIPGSRVVGPALTVRNVYEPQQVFRNNTERKSGLAEVEGHNQAREGDVLVIQGAPDISGMGGISATMGKRQGEVGAIVDGGVRDVAWQRSIGYPVWSKDITPITGKWRLDTVEVNGPVSIQDIPVRPGDLVIADETGVCFVPRDWIERVLERCEEIQAGEAAKLEMIEAGKPIYEIARMATSYQYPESR